VAVAGLAAVSACTLLTTTDQCRVDSDCKSLGHNLVCQSGVCLGESSDGSGQAPDCGVAPVGAPFVTTCTNATCVPFDDNAHFDSGLLLPVGGRPPIPEGGTMSSDGGASDGGGSSDAGSGDGGSDDGGVSDGAAEEAGAGDGGATYPPCSSLPNPVYLMGSNAALPVFQQLGTWVNQEGITLIYTKLSSCQGVEGVVLGQGYDALSLKATTSSYWDSAGNTLTCALDANSTFPDIGISAVFPTTCIPSQMGSFPNIGDFQGPVAAATWFVPAASHQTAMSAEAAYFLYSGLGKVTPWTNPKYVYLRGPTGGTQVMMGLAIGVPPTEWVGTTTNSSDLELSDVIAAGNNTMVDPNSVLGAGEADYSEGPIGKDNVTVLAYRHYGQSCAYYPNSTLTSRDMANVRDGHYVPWGPFHMVTKVGAGGNAIKQGAQTIINYFTGNQPVPNHDLLTLVINHHMVPQCAMHVKRTTEVGPVQPYAAPSSCSCFFDLTANNVTSCHSCSSPSDCPASAPACNLGYCEPQ
jgi:hypothetical protein